MFFNFLYQHFKIIKKTHKKHQFDTFSTEQHFYSEKPTTILDEYCNIKKTRNNTNFNVIRQFTYFYKNKELLFLRYQNKNT